MQRLKSIFTKLKNGEDSSMILKFCGFKSEEDIEKVKNLNVDAIGFIHFPRSKRHVSMNQLKLLSKRVPDHIYRVVVLVNPTLDLVKQVFNETNINVIQLHGSESIQLIKAIRKLSPTIKIFKAIPADKYLNRNIEKYEKTVDLFIIDTPSQNYGGTGNTYDWNVLSNIRKSRFLIAGGLDINHISKLKYLKLGQSGYDIASGIETNNIKDLAKMTQIIKIIKGDERNEHTNRS